jgi:hypothetical protein
VTIFHFIQNEREKMKKRMKIVISIILVIFLIITLGLWAFYAFVAKPDFIVDNTEWHQRYLMFGIDSFLSREKRLPVNLEEVVKAGDLWKESNLYYCPMKHHTLGTYEDIPYTQCEFEISFEPNEVKICIPEKAFLLHKQKYGMRERHKRCMILKKDGKFALE